MRKNNAPFFYREGVLFPLLLIMRCHGGIYNEGLFAQKRAERIQKRVQKESKRDVIKNVFHLCNGIEWSVNNFLLVLKKGGRKLDGRMIEGGWKDD